MLDVKSRPMAGGKATGVSVKWKNGQFCYIVTNAGILGCGIFKIEVFEEFDFVGVLMKGTPEKPYVEPEDLLEGRATVVSKAARKLGISEGMLGADVLKILVEAS